MYLQCRLKRKGSNTFKIGLFRSSAFIYLHFCRDDANPPPLHQEDSTQKESKLPLVSITYYNILHEILTVTKRQPIAFHQTHRTVLHLAMRGVSLKGVPKFKWFVTRFFRTLSFKRKNQR